MLDRHGAAGAVSQLAYAKLHWNRKTSAVDVSELYAAANILVAQEDDLKDYVQLVAKLGHLPAGVYEH
eukprot:322714-Amphidinium_carterae.1